MPDAAQRPDLDAIAAERVAALMPSQPDLLGLPETKALAEVQARKAGRPRGARNQRSEDVAKFVIEQMGDPLMRQVAVATMPLDELMAATRMTAAEALAEQRLAAGLVLPYLHRRMPQAVEVNGAAFVYLTIRDGVATPLNPSNEIVGIVENQDVSEAPHDAV